LGINDFVLFLEKYKENDLVYPSVLAEELKTDSDVICDMIEMCVAKGILRHCFVIRCSRCDAYIDNIFFDSMEEIDRKACCNHCDNKMYALYEHAVLIYKKNRRNNKKMSKITIDGVVYVPENEKSKIEIAWVIINFKNDGELRIPGNELESYDDIEILLYRYEHQATIINFSTIKAEFYLKYDNIVDIRIIKK